MADQTRLWFADTTVSYALGVIALFEHAREHRGAFVFGPLDTQSMLDGGLSVSGSEEDLMGAAKVLDGIPGLAEYWPD